MANSKISALSSATTPLAGTETLPIVQGGVTVKTTVANITNGGGYAGSFTTLDSSGNTTLGDASTDTVRVNGYMGVGGAASTGTALLVGSPTLTGTTQRGIDAATTFGTGATASVQQIRAISTLTTAGVYAEWIGLNVPQPQGTGYTLTNAYGLYISDQTKGTNNYGITSLVSSGTNKYNIYASGTAQNYFAGNVGIGVTPAVKLDVLGTIQAAAAATQDAVRLAGRAGGTGTYAVTLTPTTLTASRTLTLPDATTTVVGTDATQTLTNKTISSGTLTGTLTAGGGVGTSGQFLQSTATGVQWAAATGVLAQNTQVFTSGTAATYTAPANTQWVKVTVVGGGGAGGALVSTKGSGGGGGGVAIKSLAMTAGQTLIYTVGGAGVSSTVVSGTLTITSIVGGLGAGGVNYTYGASTGVGGGGGTATGGDLNITGGAGGSAYGSSTSITTQISGAGGNCPGFGSGGGAVGGAITAGLNGSGYGGGGGGSIGSATAGSGASGVVIFEAF
jgi:hypothetical protein